MDSGEVLQAAFELVTAIFDTSKLHGLYTTMDIMMKGNQVSFRAMDVLVAASGLRACDSCGRFVDSMDKDAIRTISLSPAFSSARWAD